MFARGQEIKKKYLVSNVCSGTRNKEEIPGVQCLLGDKEINTWCPMFARGQGNKYLVSNVCSGTPLLGECLKELQR